MKPSKNSAKDILKRISLASKDQIFQVIRSEWESRDPKIWSGSNELHLCAGKKMMELGQTFLGFDILKERYDLLKEKKEFIADNVTLIQQWALALARLGATGKAQKELMKLYDQGNREPDTIGILARTYKDLWMKTRSPLKKRKFLKSARDFYLEGYNVNKDYYNGINAASLSLFLGEKNKTKKIASKVIDICKKDKSNGSSNKYWLLATLGEAFLISGDYEKATIYYKKAFDYGIGKGEYGNLASTKQQAHLILKYLGSQKHSLNNLFNELKQVINLGNIVYCIGHMIDRHGREQQRFPATLENQVRVEIQKALEKLNAKTGYCSAANGTDILFVEEMLK
ncbi:MAG: TRAFs-binding domain-containing protein [Candidatus Anammoxibacter sp.]